MPTAAADEDVPDLTLDNVILQLTKHKFPATKWAELATHLHQEDDDPSPQLADVIERWLATNDENKSWRGLVDAVVRCKEMAVAKPLAHEVKVPFPGELPSWRQVNSEYLAALYRGSPPVDTIQAVSTHH